MPEEKQPLIPQSIRITTEQFAIIKELNINLSEWVRQKLDGELLDIKSLEKEIEKKKEDLEKLENWRKTLQQKQEESENIPEEELKFLIESKKKIEEVPHFITGRMSLWQNKFKKPYRLSKAEFFALLQKAENQQHEKEIVNS